MLTKSGLRCDICGRLDDKPEAVRRLIGVPSPFQPFSLGGLDNDGVPFVVAGLASGQMQLHFCPGCKPKLAKCCAEGDFNDLPSGPVKQALRSIVPNLIIRPGEKRHGK